MPGRWLVHERPIITQYQIVMAHNQDGDRPLRGYIVPAFAPICQYLSSTVRDMDPLAFSPFREVMPQL